MQSTKDSDPLLEEFRNCAQLYEEGDFTAREFVNKVLIDLTARERFDLVEETIPLLPEPVRQELQRAVSQILEQGTSYRGLFVIGRPSQEWWQRVRQGVVRLAELLKPLLEISPSEQG